MKRRIMMFTALSLLCLLLAGCGGGKKQATVDLNAYLTISATGYSGMGEAVWSFDTQAAMLATPEAFGLSDTTAVGDVAWTRAENALNARIGGELDKSENLKNGDEVTFQWADSVAGLSEDFDAKFTYSDMTWIVDSLTEVETFDAFEDLVVTFTGVEPNGRVKLDDSACKDLNLSYVLDKQNDLSNGDVVTVSVSNNIAQYASTYDRMPEAVSKEYTVEGLPGYLSSLDELAEDVKASYLKTAEQVVAEAVDADDFHDRCEVKTLKLVGFYLFTQKDVLPDGCTPLPTQNAFAAVYELGMRYTDEDGTVKEFTYYVPVCYENLLVNTDESFDTRYVSVPDRYFRIAEWTTLRGYETLDDLGKGLSLSDFVPERYDFETDIDGLTLSQ